MKTNLHSRPCQALQDLQTILDLVRTRPAARMLDYPAILDLQELLGTEDASVFAQVWEDSAGKLAGYAFVNTGDDFASLRWETAAPYTSPALDQEMLAWGEQVFRERYQGQVTEISTNVLEENTGARAWLEMANYRASGEGVINMECSLEGSLPEPCLPAGYTIRTLNGEAEAPAWVALHRAGFGTENMTLEYRLSMMHVPSYDPSLDLVAVGPHGELAAYVFGSITPEENALSGRQVGFTDPVATHPDHQRKGLSKALLHYAMRELQNRGMKTARLSTGSWNEAMQITARSAGFQITSRWLTYTKTLERSSTERSSTSEQT